MSKLDTTQSFQYKPCKKCGCTERRGVGKRCPECARLNGVKQMRKAQGLPSPTKPETQVCECCGKSGQMRLDHDHSTGKFRGWLCHCCNAGIGLLGDNLEGLKLAIAYLEKAHF